jgi:hypothetical protein
MELETVPDTEDYILLDKIGMGMGVYSGVYEYTQQIQEQIQSIQSIQVFGHLLSCRQDPCSIIGFFLGVKRIGRRLLYGSGFHAAQRSSAWSLALQLAGASGQNATDRTGEGSEHPSTQNPPALGCKKGEGGNPPPLVL